MFLATLADSVAERLDGAVAPGSVAGRTERVQKRSRFYGRWTSPLRYNGRVRSLVMGSRSMRSFSRRHEWRGDSKHAWTVSNRTEPRPSGPVALRICEVGTVITLAAAESGLNGWEISLVVTGLTLQIIGAVFSLRGIFLVWKEVSQPGEKFRDLILGHVRATRTKMGGWIRALFRRPPTNQTVLVTAVDSATAFGHASIRISFGQLPADTDAALAELKRQFDRVQGALQDLQQSTVTDVRDLKESVAGLGKDLRAEMDTRAEEERRLEVSSLRAEISGFWFITIGFVIGGFGSVVGALT